MDLQTDHVSDAEALVRWHSPTRDLGIHIAIVTIGLSLCSMLLLFSSETVSRVLHSKFTNIKPKQSNQNHT
ncbi:hypothetical protein [Moritella sp.]|uniref:hypothetical protein n=1 Tax=Moritella sp. TaxID=78556 RepID=UPI003423A155